MIEKSEEPNTPSSSTSELGIIFPIYTHLIAMLCSCDRTRLEWIANMINMIRVTAIIRILS